MSWCRAERGGGAFTRAALWVALHGGRAAEPLVVWTATAWFLLTAHDARRASRDYLRRVLGRAAGTWEVARHFQAFAHAVLDRVLLLAGREELFDVRADGLDMVRYILQRGEGCILLGAHLGSFEVLRALAREAPTPVWALMYRRNGGTLTALLERLNPGVHARVLEIGDTTSMIQARECVDRGEIVGILADRAPPGHRMVSVPFLGERAAFPSGPFVLASALRAPVLLFSAVRTGPRQYHVRFEPFADRVKLRREHRTDDLHRIVGRYASVLEELCRAAPYEWFNFFHFWEQRAPHADPDAAQNTATSRGAPGSSPGATLVSTGGR